MVLIRTCAMHQDINKSPVDTRKFMHRDRSGLTNTVETRFTTTIKIL